MVTVQGIVKQNKNAYHKMKQKDYRPETYTKCVFCTKINASRAVCKDIKIKKFL